MNTDSPAPAPISQSCPAAPSPPPSLVSDRLLQLIDQAEADFLADAPGGRALRSDGWTAAKIRIFLETLAGCGRVTAACAAAGMSRESAYQLRHRATGRAFHTGWNAARLVARARLADELMERALCGCFEIILRDGKVVAERHRQDNRFGLALLAQLNRQAQAPSGDEQHAAGLAAQEFEEFLDIACAGGDGAANFLEARRNASLAGETGLLARLGVYLRRKPKSGRS